MGKTEAILKEMHDDTEFVENVARIYFGLGAYRDNQARCVCEARAWIEAMGMEARRFEADAAHNEVRRAWRASMGNVVIHEPDTKDGR